MILFCHIIDFFVKTSVFNLIKCNYYYEKYVFNAFFSNFVP